MVFFKFLTLPYELQNSHAYNPKLGGTFLGLVRLKETSASWVMWEHYGLWSFFVHHLYLIH